ncbi:MAG: pyridoxal-dependent decarboxylase [Verrucomicrobiota bacterium]|nr:pyridoxal-dependent decarboxylase [Verrucomicrobiota bacterium]
MINKHQEESLDPQDWKAMRALGHRMVDDMLSYLENARSGGGWRPMPEEAKDRLRIPLPKTAEGAEAAYNDFVKTVLPYPLGNIHPRFWGWVIGTGTPLGALSEMLIGTMNSNVPGGEHSAVYVERQVLDWCKEMVGFPSGASGLLVTGCSIANLIGLTVARNVKAGFDVAQEGLAGAAHKPTFYGSVEMHSSLKKAIETIGIGRESLRLIPVDSKFEIDLFALDAAIASDKANGFRPCGIIGNAGTVNTGAIDPLDRLADVCEEENLWFHIDGAFGALAMLSPQLRPLLKGMERADSLAFDLHKWMYMNYAAGCILIRDKDNHHRSFSTSGTYLARSPRGVTGDQPWLSEYGLDLSRNAKGIKIWMSLKEHGADKYGRIIQQNVNQARYLESLVKAQDELELMVPTALNVVCLRFVHPSLSDAELNVINAEALSDVQEAGVAVPSGTVLNGKYTIRVAITNHRSRRDDFDVFVSKFVEFARMRMPALTPA